MKAFAFTQEGLEAALKHKDYIGIAKETMENHPEILPVALGITVIAAALIASPGASAIAYKSGVIDISEVAFKYVNGGF